jgi:lipid-A-disaccharide synthase
VSAVGGEGQQRPPRVMLSCGEPSGDLYAGAVIRAMSARGPVETCGFGGAQMRDAGAELIGDYRGFSVTGLTEAVSVLRRSWHMLAALEAAARSRRPDVFVAIDFPDFNFRLLPRIQALGIPIVYYISPQLWAWRPGRLATIRKYVDRMLVIFPFEEAIYRDAGVPVTFVGHPLIDLAVRVRPREATLAAAGLDPAGPVVALLPGSRPNELRLILPAVVAAARQLVADVPNLQFLVARAPSLDDDLFQPLEPLRQLGIKVGILPDAADDVLAAADVVITASGTATVQTALHGVPMVIVYRVSPLTYAIARRFVKLKQYGMVNLVAERVVAPELIQDRCTPERIAAETRRLLTDTAAADQMRADLAEVVRRLGGRGASERAADAILNEVRRP